MLSITIFYIWLFKPYMNYDHVRTSNTPNTIVAEYFTVTGEPLCTKFYKVEKGDRKSVV